MEFNLRGPTFTVATACASSNHAMGLAFQMVRSGGAKAMLTGGSEAMLCFGGIKAWEGLRVMSKDACRPFSANRNGMVQGEGRRSSCSRNTTRPRARGRDPGRGGGFAMTSDAGDIVMPSKQGAERAITGALRDARLNPEDVGYINAHGTGTAANDKTECAAVADAFGQHADRLMISSTKSMHGHLIGGTGAVELLACLMALRDGVIAPTIGYEEPDPECALDVVPNVAREAKVDVVLSNAFAFGGLNAVLALRIFVGGGGEGYGVPQQLLAEIRQPARADRRGDGDRQDGDAADPGRGFSAAGVPVFMADVKGDLAGLAAWLGRRHKLHEAFMKRSATDRAGPAVSRLSGDLLGPVRRAGPSGPATRWRRWGRCCCRG
jgi:hypothetical protein